MSQAFSEDQKQYLQGFMAGVMQSGLEPFVGRTQEGRFTDSPECAPENLATAKPVPEETWFGIPVDRLCKEEKLKREENPLDIWPRMEALAAADRFAEGGDIFRFKFHGLFNCKPNQEGYMLRCRIPGCVLDARQLRGLATIADQYGGGYAHVTTRGNLQIREIQPKNTLNTLMKLYDIGLTSRGSGADNIRNITASPIAGVDPRELYDARPLARALHHTILNSRDLYGLPRKFNVAFDGGGAISIMADTNDIGFQAVRVPEDRTVPPGIYFRPMLGGVAGHGFFARDTGLVLPPEQCVTFAAAVLRVFIENGNRTNRKRARLAYVLETLGPERFLEQVAEKLTFPLTRLDEARCLPRTAIDRQAHLGFHRQKQEELYYVGVAMPVGRLSIHQMEGLAAIAEHYGDGEIHLTIWQNVILTGIAERHIPAVKEALEALQYHYDVNRVIGGLVACTGNTGCKFSQTDTKSEALAIASHLETRLELDQPLNIVLTGCPNACAQHVCADIGLLGVKSKRQGDSIDAYNISVGGGTDQEQGLAREIFKAVPHDETPQVLERMVRVYQRQRRQQESFLAFVRRHDVTQLQTLFETVMA